MLRHFDDWLEEKKKERFLAFCFVPQHLVAIQYIMLRHKAFKINETLDFMGIFQCQLQEESEESWWMQCGEILKF